MTFDNIIFAIRDTEEVQDAELEVMFLEFEDNLTPREKKQLLLCMELNRPMLHFDIQNRLDLAEQTNEQDVDDLDDMFYTALI